MRATKDSSGWNYGKSAKDVLKKLVADRYFPVNKTGNKLEAIDEAAQALYEQIIELIGKDEPDESKDAYSQTAIYKDYRNNLRQELRQKLATYFGVEL